MSCPSRIRICPRIRHVWGPDRIYRALNAAIGNRYRGATASSSYSSRLFPSPSPLLSLSSLSPLPLSRPPSLPLPLPFSLVGNFLFLFASHSHVSLKSPFPAARARLIFVSRTLIASLYPSYLSLSVFFFFYFFSPPIYPSEEFFKGRPLLRKPPLNSSRAV